ncbi:hypothetical protein V2I01_10690 [Micromonospora sp. BRA006-A]|nr:hypothetical protein [Micromonospora sp. BRA006-A]
MMLTAAKDAGIPFLGMYVVVHSDVSIEDQAITAIDYADKHTPGGVRTTGSSGRSTWSAGRPTTCPRTSASTWAENWRNAPARWR